MRIAACDMMLQRDAIETYKARSVLVNSSSTLEEASHILQTQFLNKPNWK
jgi:hypothetical protein